MITVNKMNHVEEILILKTVKKKHVTRVKVRMC